ncbi:MAG: SH3 domain-containing protein [Caldilineaceae bacterium]|nr:SH3 domain-containing protein [Caldilineaceae bacterium]
MRRLVWLSALIPLVALFLLVVPTAVTAAEMTTHLTMSTVAPVVPRTLSTLRIQDQLTLAQQTTVTPTVSAIVLPRLSPTATVPTTLSSTTVPSDTTVLSTTAPLSGTELVTATPLLTTTLAVTSTPAITAEQALLDAEYAAPIEGTIIANRTESNIRFFVEGATYELAPLRSIGLTLPRVTAVLNLFNCDANLPETQAGCFWDPYLLNRDSFYEIVSGETGEGASLTLQTAGTPPQNQVWLQNRTGKREQLFYGGETYELPPAAVQEFTTATDTPAIFYLRSCLEVADRTVCEWAPNDAMPGYYYALVEVSVNGAMPNSRVNALALEPIVSNEGTAPVESTSTPTVPAQVSCRVLVPTLNVRSGPGLQYQIIDKVRSTEQEPATLAIVGRDAAGQWLALSTDVVAGGWVSGSSGFVTCASDVTVLPVAEVRDGRLAPTPAADAPTVPDAVTTTDAVETPAAAVVEVPTEETPIAEAVPTATVLTIPPGQALIVIHNGFEQQIRFTLDQIYRVEVGPSEFDLQPGESIQMLVYPGMITFSASTPWRGISGNDDFVIDAEQSRDLWITFVPDPDGSGRWILQF